MLARLRATLERDDPSLLPWLPLLADAFDVEAPPSQAVDQLAPEFRAARLREVVLRFMRRQLPAWALIEIADAHLMDTASAELRRGAGARAAAAALARGRLAPRPQERLHGDARRARAAPGARAARAGRVARAGRGRDRGGAAAAAHRQARGGALGRQPAVPARPAARRGVGLDRAARQHRERGAGAPRPARAARPRPDPARVGPRPELPSAPARRPARRRRARARRGHLGTARRLLQGRRPTATCASAARSCATSPTRACRSASGASCTRRPPAGSSATSAPTPTTPPRGSPSTTTAPACTRRRGTTARLAADRASERAAFADAASLYRRALESAHQLDVAPGELAAVWESLADAYLRTGELRAQRPRAHQRAPAGRRRPGAHRAPAVAARAHRRAGGPRLARGALVQPGAAHARRRRARPRPPCRSHVVATLAGRAPAPGPDGRGGPAGAPGDRGGRGRRRGAGARRTRATSSTGRSSCRAARPRPATPTRALEIFRRHGAADRESGGAQQHGRASPTGRAAGTRPSRSIDAAPTRACARATSTSPRSRTATSASCCPTRVAWRRRSRCCGARCRSGAGPPTSTASRSSTALLGRLHARVGRTDEAVELLEDALARFEALRVEIDAALVKALLAEAALFAGRAEEAHERARALLDELPEDALLEPLLHHVAGVALAQMGQTAARGRRVRGGARRGARSRAAVRDGARARRARTRLDRVRRRAAASATRCSPGSTSCGCRGRRWRGRARRPRRPAELLGAARVAAPGRGTKTVMARPAARDPAAALHARLPWESSEQFGSRPTKPSLFGPSAVVVERTPRGCRPLRRTWGRTARTAPRSRPRATTASASSSRLAVLHHDRLVGLGLEQLELVVVVAGTAARGRVAAAAGRGQRVDAER